MVPSSAKASRSASRSCSAGPSPLVLASIVAGRFGPLGRVRDVERLGRCPGQPVHLQEDEFSINEFVYSTRKLGYMARAVDPEIKAYHRL